MNIQFNSGNNIPAREELTSPLKALITKSLNRFDRITRIEVHLSDEDGNKNGPNDKRCMLEARLKGIQPIAVTNYANTHKDAVRGAIEKLKTSLEHKLVENHQHC